MVHAWQSQTCNQHDTQADIIKQMAQHMIPFTLLLIEPISPNCFSRNRDRASEMQG